MFKINTGAYAQMANRVYKPRGQQQLDGFNTGPFHEGTSYGGLKYDGFAGVVYLGKGESVVAFRGTEISDINDLTADLKILIGVLPNQANSAMRLFQRCLEQNGDKPISLVGHSLGGALAQIIGHWTGCPFVTFNAPGVWGDIQRSKINVFEPGKMFRSLKGTFIGPAFAKQSASTGRNFRHVLDPVSSYGMHYGPVTRFWNKEVHGMDAMAETIDTSEWSGKQPFDPKNKEWGEL